MGQPSADRRLCRRNCGRVSRAPLPAASVPMEAQGMVPTTTDTAQPLCARGVDNKAATMLDLTALVHGSERTTMIMAVENTVSAALLPWN